MKFSSNLLLVVIHFGLLFSFTARPSEDLFFPQNYDQSRERFRASCLKAVNHPLSYCRSQIIKSQADSDLTIDYGFFRNGDTSGGNRLLVIESGIHGPEAPAGAAVQELFFQRYLSGFLKRGTDVLLIHSLNPYGFKYSRRGDEFNINLNRNFSTGVEIFSTKNEAYQKLRSLFEPQSKVGSASFRSIANRIQFILSYFKSGFDKGLMNQAMNSGQYDFEQGLSFGGHEPSQQSLFMNHLLSDLFKKYSGKILFLDFHTGLGESGVLQIMNGVSPSVSMLEQANGYWGALTKHGIKMTNVYDSKDPNFYSIHGDVIDFVPGLAPQPENVLALTMEYGTLGVGMLGQLKAASRVILENQAHFFGCKNPSTCELIQREFNELFNPLDTQWRRKVLNEADLVFSKLLERF